MCGGGGGRRGGGCVFSLRFSSIEKQRFFFSHSQRAKILFSGQSKNIFFSKQHICSNCILLDLYVRVFLEPNIHGYIVYMFVYTCILDIWARVYMSRDMTNQQNGCAPSEDSDQPGHPPILIRVFAVRMKNHWVLSSLAQGLEIQK